MLKSCILHHQGAKGCNQGKHSVSVLAFPWASSLGQWQRKDWSNLGAWPEQLSLWSYNQNLFTRHQCLLIPLSFPMTGRQPKLCAQAAPGLTVGLTTSPAAWTERNPLPSATADTRTISEGWDASFLPRGNPCPQAFSALHCTYLAGASPDPVCSFHIAHQIKADVAWHQKERVSKHILFD